MAELAREIIADNSLADTITVLAKSSFQIDPQTDFPAGLRPNLIVAEIFDATVIGEGALASFAPARTRLVAAGARKCVVWGKRVYVRVARGGRRHCQKTNTTLQ